MLAEVSVTYSLAVARNVSFAGSTSLSSAVSLCRCVTVLDVETGPCALLKLSSLAFSSISSGATSLGSGRRDLWNSFSVRLCLLSRILRDLEDKGAAVSGIGV